MTRFVLQRLEIVEKLSIYILFVRIFRQFFSKCIVSILGM